MQAIDAAAIETFAIPRVLLMDHAGVAVARAAAAQCTDTSRPILVCCGTGFNGGDGLSAARHLSAQGYPLRVLLVGRVAALRDEPAGFATMLQRLGVAIHEVDTVERIADTDAWWGDAAVIIDALLGIGLRGSVREPTASLIDRMNRSGTPIVAVDIPSGLDGDTGQPQGQAVRAACTVTFGLPKHGCFVGQGPEHVGALVVEPITFPPHLLESY
jgi:NAD(P)H-hydrate epimerase